MAEEKEEVITDQEKVDNTADNKSGGGGGGGGGGGEATTTAGAAVAPIQEGQLDSEGNHLLEYNWTLWFDSHSKVQNQVTYGQSRRKVYSFSTVQDFWRLFNNIKPPSEFGPNTDYFLFKDGIEPEWEDPRNEKGGCWSISIEKSNRVGMPEIDDIWYKISLALIGDQFEEGEEICGLVCSIRSRGPRLQLWNRNADKEELIMSIGNQFKKMMGITEAGKLGYVMHEDSIKGTKSKDKYTL